MIHPALIAVASFTALVWLIALAWLWKAITATLGLARIPNLTEPRYDHTPPNSPSVTVIVPARNEAADITACLTSLLQQDYPNLRILAVNDRSTDSTGAILDTLAAQHPTKLRALHITDLPAGWLGKTHAMALAARQAIAADNPDFLLFTDADVLFHPTILRRSLAQAVVTQADHFVTLPNPIIRSPGEAVLLGFMQVMGLWASRLWRVEDPRALRDAVGIGAFNLLCTPAYLQIGGFDALRMQIIEDVTLARRIKLAGLRQRVAFAPGMVNLHWAAGAVGVINVMTKNLFAVFAFRPLFLLASCVGLTLLWLTPLAALALPATRLPAILTLICIAALYDASTRFSRIPVWTALAYPFAVAGFIYSLLRSMVITLHQGGVTWRGTFYSLAELRKNAEKLT
jgi:glycosyltransferase involved in cell wall biosynthesis